MPTSRGAALASDDNPYETEWRASIRDQLGVLTGQQQQTAIILERVEGHLNQHDQAIAGIRAQPAHVRAWLSSGVSWLGVLMTALGTGCGCFGVVSVGATAITAVATIIYLIAFFKP